MKYSRSLMIVLLAVVTAGCSQNQPTQNQSEEGSSWELDEIAEQERYPLLLVGLDGFKPSYLTEVDAHTPFLDLLVEGGVRAESLKPVFPSHTFPNLYSMVTGLYPENHGIIGNTIYDPDRDVRFHMSDSEEVQDSRWWGGEPIWVTAELQGLTAATFFWVGSEALIKGVQPTYWKRYDSRIRHNTRTDQVIDWLTGDDPVDFATLYFANTDGAGHAHGPHSQNVVNAVEGLDRQIGRLINGLDQAGLWPDINIVIVSDHGMVELDEDKVIFLDDIIDLTEVHMIEWTPVATIAPRADRTDAIYNALKENEDNYTVYRREDLPDRLRYRNHRLVPELVVIADMPYTLTSRSYLQDRGLNSGGHGFDPKYAEMHGFFVAHGPDFPEARITETLEIVDLYPLMTHLLALDPAEHDGSLERIGRQVFGD